MMTFLKSVKGILVRMQVLVVHEVDYINKPFFEFQEFAAGLSARGNQVTVLHVQEFSRKTAKRLGSIEEIHGFHVPNTTVRLYSSKFVVSGIFSRLIMVFEHARLLLRIFVMERPDVVLSYSVPTSGVTVALLGKIFGIPVVHRAIDVSHLLRSRLVAPLVRLSEIATFALSTSVSTHNPALKSYVQETTGGEQASVDYPPVYPIEVSVRPTLEQQARQLNLIFIGTLAHFTDLETVFGSLSFLAPDSKINLRVVGSGPKEEELKRLSKSMGLDGRIDFRGWKQRKDFAEELSWADIGIVPFHKNLLTDCALPHKAIEYLSSGLPVVSTSLKGAESVLGEIQGMYFVESSEEIIEQCVNLAREQRLTSVDKDLVNERFSRDATVENMEKMLIDVTRNKGK
jgi:glycosyltransferase involved in cell wall biosynthesis